MRDLSDVDVVVLAGGLGTRIRPVLGDTPKLLAPIGDETYLTFLLKWLKRYGVRRMILSLGHLSEKITDALAADPVSDMDIETVIEREPLGTAGALRMVADRINGDLSMVMNGDSWTGADLAAFIAQHERSDAIASLLCVRVADAGRYGAIETDPDGRIVHFREKQPDAGPGLINAGVYAFGSDAWTMIAESEGPSLERDVYARQTPGTLAAFDAGNAPFIDIGTPESLRRSQEMLLHSRIK